LALRENYMGLRLPGRKGAKAGKKNAVKCEFSTSEFFTSSDEIFLVLDDQDRSSG
jgi:hypothetical protein